MPVDYVYSYALAIPLLVVYRTDVLMMAEFVPIVTNLHPWSDEMPLRHKTPVFDNIFADLVTLRPNFY